MSLIDKIVNTGNILLVSIPLLTSCSTIIKGINKMEESYIPDSSSQTQQASSSGVVNLWTLG